jgi:NAD(P)-dependent dehydrogenase (short-subunit alcohol dehydrogenase family)
MDHTPRLRISSIAPGVIDTDMQTEIRASTVDDFPDRPRFDAMHRDGALQRPADVAERVIAYLLSETFGAEPVADLGPPSKR